MYSKQHLVISVVIALGLVATAPASATDGWGSIAFVVGYAAGVGVLVDLDHFLIAWVNSGEPRAIRDGVADPRSLLLEQDALFEAGEVSKLERLLSHVLVVGVAVPAAWIVAPFLGVVTAAVLYAHVLADLVWDVARVRRGIDDL